MMPDDKCTSLTTGAFRQIAVSSVKENGGVAIKVSET
jgi:hypothetical protein